MHDKSNRIEISPSGKGGGGGGEEEGQKAKVRCGCNGYGLDGGGTVSVLTSTVSWIHSREIP